GGDNGGAGGAGGPADVLGTAAAGGADTPEVGWPPNNEEGGGRGEPGRPSGGGWRQGLSQQRHADGAAGRGGANLHLGARSRAAPLERKTGGADSGVRQPAADSWRAWKRTVAAARRVAGTQLRACL